MFGFVADQSYSLKSKTLALVFIHANTNFIDKVTDVCYEEPSASWGIELEQYSEDAEVQTDDTDSTAETE